MRIETVALIVVFGVTLAASANVLVLCPMCTKSHLHVLVPIFQGLAERNHSVTVVSSHQIDGNHSNVRDMMPLEGFDLFAHANPIEIRKSGFFGLVNGYGEGSVFKAFLNGCHDMYRNQEFMSLLEERFDLVFIDTFFHHCLMGFVYKLKAPVIWSMSLPSPRSFTIILGTETPPSFVPEIIMPFGEDMNIWQRVVNFVVPSIFFHFYFSNYPKYERIYRSYLGEDVPGIRELEANISMMFVNSHFSVNYPRPRLPDIVEIGGVHCRPGKPLPQELDNFISGAREGLIVFSLGSVFKGKDMPEGTRKVLVSAFSQLGQRVLWKWDYHDMDDLPSNVRLSKWLPLQDVLAHPNTKLFITHGGLLSTQEAIYHGVPLVGIPLFGDQDLNVNRYIKAGFAVGLEIIGITEENILNAIKTVLHNESYSQNVQKLSRLFRDQPESALDRAIFWSEYVMRHNGAPQLRSIARNLSYVQYHSLDVIAILISAFLTTLILFSCACMSLVRRLHLLPQAPKVKLQ